MKYILILLAVLTCIGSLLIIVASASDDRSASNLNEHKTHKNQRHEKEAIQKRKKRLFQCFVCNSDPNDDDTKPCVDKVETCADGVRSCSTVVFYTSANNLNGSTTRVRHMRKFCTSPGTAIYKYLVKFPNSSLCQNINTKNTIHSEIERVGPKSTTLMPTVPDNTFNIEVEPLGLNERKVLPGPPSIRPPPAKLIHASSGRIKRTTRTNIKAGPPAPPHATDSNIVCACSEHLCNFGELRDVLDRSLLSNLNASKATLPN